MGSPISSRYYGGIENYQQPFHATELASGLAQGKYELGVCIASWGTYTSYTLYKPYGTALAMGK